jgi:hypothetical protein
VRFCYRVISELPRALTRSNGRDRVNYLGFSLKGCASCREVRFSEFDESVHSFRPMEQVLDNRHFEDRLTAIGPMLVAEGRGISCLVAYEHGSQTPDAFVQFELAPDRQVVLRAVKGNTHHGQALGPSHPFETIWFNAAVVRGHADEMIRLNRELGVTYFKWDAIGQYGCNDPHHWHGDESNSSQERADRYAFELGRYMMKVVNKVCAACPEAIVDFDITEGGRFVGLGFLAVGKYFLINNGPYFGNLDYPGHAQSGWSNVFVYPGPARARLCRAPLDFDKWIPSVLFLTHYLPDDPDESQWINLASLILGQNGIWGDLPAISEDGVKRFGEVLGLYKRVRDDITLARPVRTGICGGSPEVHEKINPATGKGAVCVFAAASGRYTYVTANTVTEAGLWHTEGVRVERDKAGRARLTLDFAHPGAKIVLFGV